ncbi:uncharacterized protein MYCFIDRAFT_172769 [Pseudocercospora fijiensis CIRAD86]|uniref:Uncharacterized protein n=1 Tax=Pseudocercospora fijiensis (strain CIRAD86) TaxID=383855 RepID=M3BD76_PSEFD|nr:uncharacterized protein MYCFIDRAFT_172769 [Pseudocercospora fijiensis CIRAD86]EME87103.1 hypothetical protein MYCFIDRAFT_172769 [Pseudocercospora fijiensis CIRAD86]
MDMASSRAGRNTHLTSHLLKTYAEVHYSHRRITLGDIGMLAKAYLQITFKLEAKAEDLWSVELKERFLLNVQEIRIANVKAEPLPRQAAGYCMNSASTLPEQYIRRIHAMEPSGHAAFMNLASWLTTFHFSGWIDDDDTETGDEFIEILAGAPYL